MKAPWTDPVLREFLALLVLAAFGCGLALARGDLLFAAIFAAASAVTIIGAIGGAEPRSQSAAWRRSLEGKFSGGNLYIGNILEVFICLADFIRISQGPTEKPLAANAPAPHLRGLFFNFDWAYCSRAPSRRRRRSRSP
jgi:hypothetical protein